MTRARDGGRSSTPSWRFYLRHLMREGRGLKARFAFFAACLAVGVAAVVAVAGLSSGVERGVRSQARQLLAADIAVEGFHPIPRALDDALASLPGARRSDVLEMVSLASAPGIDGLGKTQLVELKAVDDNYPFFGSLKLRRLATQPAIDRDSDARATRVKPGNQEREPIARLADVLTAETAVAAPELLSRLGLSEGGVLSLGGAEFRVVAAVLEEPDRILSAFRLGPRLFLSREGLARTDLVRLGSRVLRRALVKLPNGADTSKSAEVIKAALGSSPAFRVESASEAQPALRKTLSRIDRYLGLVALLSLLVGGAGAAWTLRAWLLSRLDAVAVLKCLGMRPREVFGLFLAQMVALGLLAGVLGSIVGVLTLLAVPRLLHNLLPAAWIDPFPPLAILRGVGLGLGVGLLFSFPPLLEALRVPPSRVLRRDVEPLPPSRAGRLGTAMLVLFGVAATAALEARSTRLGALFTAGLLSAAGILYAAGWLATRAVALLGRETDGLASRLFRGLGPARHGVTALARPGAGTRVAVVALGLGILVIVALAMVETHLTGQLAAELPKDAPTAFLLDVQTDQWPGVQALLVKEGATRLDSVPVVMARLSALDGRRVEDLAKEPAGESAESRRWALTREQRLTYMPNLPADNRVVEGALFREAGEPEVSLEAEFARKNLGVRLGSRLEFDVQGVPISLKVTSLRTVDWRTFGINFFFVVEPGVLEGAPQFRLVAARLPREREERVEALLARQFPNVTVIKTREVLERMAAVLSRLGTAVRFLGLFTVISGIVLLAGAVSASSVRRVRETAILKVLGFTRAGVARIHAIEYALIGLVAGSIGTIAGAVLAWATVTKGIEIPWTWSFLQLAAWPVGTPIVTAVAGLLATAGALRARPIRALAAD